MNSGHFNEKGEAVMLDISGKAVTVRTAVARGEIKVAPEVISAIKSDSVEKGDVLGVARVAGIMAVKRTAGLIPMCHPLTLNKCSVDFEIREDESTVAAVCTAVSEGKTGVEMEALTGVSVALLTVYDMCKSMDKRMCIGDIHLVSKKGGKSGDFYYGTGAGDEMPSRA